MSLRYKKVWSDQKQLQVWRIEESENYFINLLNWVPKEKALFDSLKGSRKIEWLASRFMICTMLNLPDTSYIIKDEFGKPYIKNSKIKISVSHTDGYAAVVISNSSNPGIDIQKKVDKIYRIAHKYLNTNQLEQIPEDIKLQVLHIQWGAKEALYKAYGRKKLDYIAHIFTDSITHIQYPVQFLGKINKDDFSQDYKLTSISIDDCILVYAF